MISGARKSKPSRLRRLLARAMARELAAFVVPGREVARAHGLDPEAVGLRLAATPRHASVLLLVGELPEGLERAAAVAYAQMPRPRAILAVGVPEVSLLSAPAVSVALGQSELASGVAELRRAFSERAFSSEATGFDLAAVRTETEYVCPMHPQVVRSEPGSCPICGMDLVPRETVGEEMDHGAMSHKVEDHGIHMKHGSEVIRHEPMAQEPEGGDAHVYTCPMHPEVVKDGPGSCPKCGMELVPHEPTDEQMHNGDIATTQADAEGERGRTEYTCPMHSEIVSKEQGSCPICRMDLVSRESEAELDSLTTATGRGWRGDHTKAGRRSTHEDGMPGEHTHAAMAGGRDETQYDEGPANGHAGHVAGGEVGRNSQDDMGRDTVDHGGMDHESMGFMSMVALTKDLPRSPDGLPMEWVETPFGPLFPGLPGGLDLRFTLDGDSVAEAAVRPGTVSRRLEATWLCEDSTFPERLARLDPLTPVAYWLLAQRALEDAAGVAPDGRTLRAHVGALERERAVSHLGWLADFARLLGAVWLDREAVRLQLALLRAASIGDVARLEPAIRRLVGRAQRTPGLSRRLRGTGCLDLLRETRGPVARASGLEIDARTSDPAYGSLAFAPVIRQGDDALARLQVRLSEIIQSLEMIRDVGDFSVSGTAVRPPASGVGAATVETSRGAAALEISLEGGRVTRVRLDTPSTAHLGLVSRVAEGRELADALVGVASLDLSPWEVDR